MGLVALYTSILAAVGTFIAGWINNILWTFQQESLGDIALGIVGIFVPFIGAFHGAYLWF